MSTKKKPKKVSHIHKFIDANKELKEGFWKGNKRREDTEHLTYTTRDGDGIGCHKGVEPKPECDHEFNFSQLRERTNGNHTEEEAYATCKHCGWIKVTKPSPLNLANPESKEPEKEEWREQCQLIVDSTYGKNAIDDMLRDYYTKEEEREFRSDLLHLLEWEIKHSPKKRDSYRKTVIESIRKKFL